MMLRLDGRGAMGIVRVSQIELEVPHSRSESARLTFAERQGRHPETRIEEESEAEERMKSLRDFLSARGWFFDLADIEMVNMPLPEELGPEEWAGVCAAAAAWGGGGDLRGLVEAWAMEEGLSGVARPWVEWDGSGADWRLAVARLERDALEGAAERAGPKSWPRL